MTVTVLSHDGNSINIWSVWTSRRLPTLPGWPVSRVVSRGGRFGQNQEDAGMSSCHLLQHLLLCGEQRQPNISPEIHNLRQEVGKLSCWREVFEGREIFEVETENEVCRTVSTTSTRVHLSRLSLTTPGGSRSPSTGKWPRQGPSLSTRVRWSSPLWAVISASVELVSGSVSVWRGSRNSGQTSSPSSLSFFPLSQFEKVDHFRFFYSGADKMKHYGNFIFIWFPILYNLITSHL